MFGIDSYKYIIKNFLKNDFEFSFFSDALHKKSICLRHDIDFSIQDALKIAIIEDEIGIYSSYFIMISSNTYNPFSESNFKAIKKIKSLGHKISLHFDPSIYNDPLSGFKKEKKIFESFFKINIDLFSIHKPGKFLDDNNRHLDNCEHTYQNKYFKDMTYISDSGGKDIQDKLKNFLSFYKGETIHLLLHPIWWTQTNNNPTQTLENWINNQKVFLTSETKKNVKTFKIN